MIARWSADSEAARRDINRFVELGMRDIKTRAPWEQQPFQREWQALIDAENRVIIWAPIEHGKTEQIAVARVLFHLGRNPDAAILIVGSTEGSAKKRLAAVREHIERNPAVRAIFPHLRPSADRDQWGTQAITVKRSAVRKEPSVQAAGIGGAILGDRVDLLIGDDLLDFKNASTSHQRETIYRWFKSTALGRVGPEGKIILIQTAWAHDDLAHRLAREEPGIWRTIRHACLDEGGGPVILWPGVRDEAWIDYQRRILGPLEAARQLANRCVDEGGQRFKREWFDACKVPGLPMGLPHEKGARITGVDLAVRRKDSSGRSCFFSLSVCPKTKHRRVLEIVSGRWTFDEIKAQAHVAAARWGSLLVIEDNAAQDYLVQDLRGRTAIPILGSTTTAHSKAHPEFGIESMAAEFAGGQWEIPADLDGNVEPEVAEWIAECQLYDPTGHPGDRLMASWKAREGAQRMGGRGTLSEFAAINDQSGPPSAEERQARRADSASLLGSGFGQW